MRYPNNDDVTAKQKKKPKETGRTRTMLSRKSFLRKWLINTRYVSIEHPTDLGLVRILYGVTNQ